MIKSAKFHHPASIIISGSSGVGKTTFAFRLIERQHFTKPIRNVYYFGCNGTKAEDLNWHTKLPDVAVTYSEGLPTSEFLMNIKKNSIVCIDDQYENAIDNDAVARAFTVDRRHNQFSLILITQVCSFIEYFNNPTRAL